MLSGELSQSLPDCPDLCLREENVNIRPRSQYKNAMKTYQASATMIRFCCVFVAFLLRFCCVFVTFLLHCCYVVIAVFAFLLRFCCVFVTFLLRFFIFVVVEGMETIQSTLLKRIDVDES